MILNKDFIKAWRVWNLTPDVPIEKPVLTTTLCAKRIVDKLKDLSTYIYTLGQDVISGDTDGIAETALSDLSTLEELSHELEYCDLPKDIKESLAQYIANTRILLEEMVKQSLNR